MQKKEFMMVGAPIITKEIFRKVLMPLDNYSFKPSGGFWSSPFLGNLGISDWYTYLQDASSIARYKDLNQSTIFTLKDDAKILIIDTFEKILELAQKYPSYHHIQGFYNEITTTNTIFDFSKLSQDYDGIYIDYDKFMCQNKTIVFDKLSVNSLLLFNLDCIKEYKTTPITFDIYNPYSFPYIKKDEIKPPQKVEEESYEHRILTEKTELLYLEAMNKYTYHSFEDYDKYLTALTENVKKVMGLLSENEIEKIIKIEKYLQSNGMHITSEQIIQNLVLNFMSEYILQDEERIKTLTKSTIKTSKRYQIY